MINELIISYSIEHNY
jgi:hypothetical protein